MAAWAAGWAAIDWLEAARWACTPFRMVPDVIVTIPGMPKSYAILPLLLIGLAGLWMIWWVRSWLARAVCLYLLAGSGLTIWLLARGHL